MKLRIFIIFAVLTFLSGGSQTLLAQEGAAPNRGNAVPADMLPDELQGLDIKDYFISFDAKEAGVIQTMVGHVVMRHGDSGQAYFAAPGDKIFEKDVIFTLKESRCRLKFLDDNLITMSENTNVGVKEFITNLELKEKKSVFSVVKGKAMFYALKLFRYRKADMSVETPTAVAGIRGTKFGVEVKKVEGESAASRPIYLADASETGWVRLAQAGSDGTTTVGSYTVVYSFDGTVTVTSTVTGESVTLSAGEFVNMFTTGAGEVNPTPEGLSRLFQDDTSAPDGGEGDEGAGGAGDDGGDGDGGDDGSTDTGDTTTSTDVTQQQTTKEEDEKVVTDPVTDPKTNATGTQVGYFSGMLTNQSGSSLEEVFASKTRQDFNGDNIWARGSKDTSSDYMRAGPGYILDNPYAKWAMFDSRSKNSGDLGDNHAINHSELGHISGEDSDYLLEWGYWTIPTKFTVDSVDYLVDNRGYYIFGDDTATMPSTASAYYSGNAYGTYWSSGSGTNMTGTFSCDVNFSTAAISDFDLSVLSNDESTSASITDATGSFSGSSYFQITGDTWDLNGETPDDKMCYGSFYGSSADYIGGNWGMYHTSSNTGAVGIFKGDKSSCPATHNGYYTGMLTYNPDGLYWKATFISTTPQDFDSADVRADEVGGEEYSTYVKMDGTNSPKIIKEWVLSYSGDLWSGSETVIQPEVNYNAYMEWGYWTQPVAMTVGINPPVDHYFYNRGYYVCGDNTEILPPDGEYRYSGPAYGTYWTSGGDGAHMGGTFSTDVNFAAETNQLSNFTLDVAGNDHEAHISSGVGNINNTPGGHFEVTSGTYTIGAIGGNPYAAGSAYGSFYGPGAEAMGGVYQMGYGGAHVVGSFVSDTKTTP